MATHPLDALLRPRSVALIGASTRTGSIGQILLSNLIEGGFEGPIYAINPRELDVKPAIWVASLADLPEQVDLAIIATPAATVPALVAALGVRGTRVAIVVSAGFTVENGLRQGLIDAARRHSVRIIGPNCLGLMMPHVRLNGTFARTEARSGHLALISQSGALVTAMLDWAEARHLGFSGVVSAGDMTAVDLADLIELFGADPNTSVIALYVEGVNDGAKFVASARAARQHKPIVAIKAGRSPDALQAVRSHTGALMGSADIYEAAFRRAGIVQVPNLLDLFDAAETLCLAPPAAGPRLAIISNGGGSAILAVDALAGGPGCLASLSEATVAALDDSLPPLWSHANPVDLVGDAPPERFTIALRAALADDGVDAVLILHCPTAVAAGEEVATAVAEFARMSYRTKPILGCWLGTSNGRAACPILAESGIPSFESPEDAIEGFNCLLRANDLPLSYRPGPLPDRGRIARARNIIDACIADGRAWLDELESKQLLEVYGIKTAPTRFASTHDEVREAAGDIAPPFAVKIVSPDILHKSDAGGVRLGLATADAAAKAAGDMAASIRERFPEARIRGFAVESMISLKHGYELIVGMKRDPAFGAVLAVGAGGKAVEVIGDKAVELAPVDMALAAAMIGRTRISRLLAGYRDELAVDLDGIAAIVTRVSDLAVELPQLVELDLNPLLAAPTGVWVLDARVRVG